MRPGLFVAYGPRGRGVFTHHAIPKGAVVEVAPCIDLPEKEVGLDGYYYDSPEDGMRRVAFGYAMLYAHDPDPNMAFHHGSTEIIFTALREIPAGQELTMDYGSEYRWGSHPVIKGNVDA